MYHQFASIESEINQNNELPKMISHYITQLKRRNNKLGRVFTQIYIHVGMVVENFQHNTRLYILSNGKVLRYDNENNSVCQIEGLQGEEITQMKALDIGQEERYVLTTDNGLSVCTIRGDEIKAQIVPLEQGQQKMHQQQQFQTSKSITINTLHCELIGSVFIEQKNPQQQGEVEQNNQNQNQHEQQQQQQSNFQFKKMIIINRSNNHQLNEKKDIIDMEVDAESVLVAVVGERDSVRKLAVYQVTVRERKIKDKYQLSEEIIGENQNHNQATNPNNEPNQHCSIKPILLPNNTYSIRLLLTITATQLSTENFLLSRTHPLIKADYQICPQSNSFSIYFVTRTICYWVDPDEWRNHILEFQFFLNDRNQLKSENQEWKINAPTLLYGKKKVLIPRRVYSLPLLQDQSTTLRYFTIKKTPSQKTQSPTYFFTKEKIQLQNLKTQFTIRITVVLKEKYENQITFLQTQLKITKGNYNQFLFVINQQNLSFYTVLKQRFILINVLMVDCINQYAILLVNENGLAIKLPDEQQEDFLKLIVVNLTAKTTSTSTIVSQFQLYDICNLSLSIPKELNTKGSLLMPQLSSALINKPKQIEVTYSSTRNNRIHSQLIGLIPKVDIYLGMLQSVLGIKQNKQAEITTKQVHQEFSQESFMNTVISLLSA